MVDRDEFLLNACGYDDENEIEPKSYIYILLKTIDLDNKREQTINSVAIDSAGVFMGFDDRSFQVALCFDSPTNSSLRLVPGIYDRFVDMAMAYEDGKPYPELSMYIVPKVYEGKNIMYNTFPVDFRVVSDDAGKMPKTLLFTFEYDTAELIELPEFDLPKIKRELDIEEERENEEQRRKNAIDEQRAKIEEMRRERLQNLGRKQGR